MSITESTARTGADVVYLSDRITPTAPFTLLQGEGLSADEAAWCVVAEAADFARGFPELSSETATRLQDLSEACIRALMMEGGR